MKRKMIQVIAMVMAVMLLATSTNLTAYAEEGSGENPTSGNCGAPGNEENVTWNFDSATGTLTISGTGAMADYDIFPEWSISEPKRNSITKIVIGFGITQIGKNAFYGCINVEEVVFERDGNGNSSVTTIGSAAFRTVNKLTSIVIPASVEEIGNDSFHFCTQLQNIIFEEGSNLTTIGEQAFRSVACVEEYIIPSNVNTIANNAFRVNNALKRFYYPSGASFGESVFISSNKLEYLGKYTINETDKTCSVSYIGFNTTTWLPDDNILPDEAKIVIPDKIDGYKVVEAKIGDTIIYKYTEPHADDGNDNNTSEETEEQIFTRELLTKVAGAKAGDNVVIDATIWHSFSAKVLEQLFAKEGVSYTIYYHFEGEYFYITIPANAALEEGIDWYGPLKLNAMFGRTMITKAEYEKAIAKLQEQAR